MAKMGVLTKVPNTTRKQLPGGGCWCEPEFYWLLEAESIATGNEFQLVFTQHEMETVGRVLTPIPSLPSKMKLGHVAKFVVGNVVYSIVRVRSSDPTLGFMNETTIAVPASMFDRALDRAQRKVSILPKKTFLQNLLD